MKIKKIFPIFVEFIPEKIETGNLYISDEYGVAVHLCCCGCGEKVVTPLSPVDWSYIKSPRGVSLTPSIGNWNYDCRSHYFIRNNGVIWAGEMSDKQIVQVKERDLQDQHAYIAAKNANRNSSWISKKLSSIWKKVKNLFS